MDESAGLENRSTGNCTVGSNPTLSAITLDLLSHQGDPRLNQIWNALFPSSSSPSLFIPANLRHSRECGNDGAVISRAMPRTPDSRVLTRMLRLC